MIVVKITMLHQRPWSLPQLWRCLTIPQNKKVKYAFYTGDDDSTNEAHIRQKVSYGVEKFSDILHMKRSLTSRLYNLSHSTKFADSSSVFHMLLHWTKEMQKQSRQPLTAMFPTDLATIKTVTISGCIFNDIPKEIGCNWCIWQATLENLGKVHYTKSFVSHWMSLTAKPAKGKIRWRMLLKNSTDVIKRTCPQRAQRQSKRRAQVP